MLVTYSAFEALTPSSAVVLTVFRRRPSGRKVRPEGGGAVYLSFISVLPRLYRGFISVVPRLYPALTHG